jgi:hypothetical protein
MPVRFLYVNIKMAGSLLKIGKRQIPFGVRDVLDLIESRHCIADMGCVGHRLFPSVGKCEDRGWQQVFLGRGKSAMRCRARRFPSGLGHGLIFHRRFQVFRNCLSQAI